MTTSWFRHRYGRISTSGPQNSLHVCPVTPVRIATVCPVSKSKQVTKVISQRPHGTPYPSLRPPSDTMFYGSPRVSTPNIASILLILFFTARPRDRFTAAGIIGSISPYLMHSMQPSNTHFLQHRKRVRGIADETRPAEFTLRTRNRDCRVQTEWNEPYLPLPPQTLLVLKSSVVLLRAGTNINY